MQHRSRRAPSVALCVLALLLIAGCEQATFDPTTDVPPTTRLKQTRYRIDGVELAAGSGLPYVDDERDETCTPQRWADGEVRCTPEWSHGAYLDDGCTEVVSRGGPGYVAEVEWECGTWRPSRFFHTGGAGAVERPIWLRARDGSCNPSGAQVTHAVVEVIAPEELVTIEETEEQGDAARLVSETTADGSVRPVALEIDQGVRCASGGGSINADEVTCGGSPPSCEEEELPPVEPRTFPRTAAAGRSRVTERRLDGGGVFLPAGLYDTELEHDCFVVPDVDGTLRCMPATYSFRDTFFLDPGCTEERQLILGLSLGDEGFYAASPYASATPEGGYVGEGHEAEVEVLELGAPYAGPVYWVAGTCKIADFSFFEPGPTVPAETFPVVELVLR